MMDNNRENVNGLSIRIFDVGHGDSILIEFPDGEHVGIVDCHVHEPSHRGCGSEFWDRCEPKLLTWLRGRLGRGDSFKVGFICLSHFHDDHYLGFGQLARALEAWEIPIARLWDPGKSIRRATARRLKSLGWTEEQSNSLLELEDFYKALKAFKRGGMELEPLTKPEEGICRIAEVGIDILAPNGWHWDQYKDFLLSPEWGEDSKKDKESTDEHLVCSAIMLRYGQTKVILGADLTCRGWDEVVKKWGGKVAAHAAKVSHHGSLEGNFLPSGSSNGPSLWKYISLNGSTVGVISGGYRKCLPHVDTIAELKANGVRIYCTGDFTRFIEDDPILGMALAEDVRTHIANTSEPIVEDICSYHGDITLRVHKDGIVEVATEHDIGHL